MAGSTRARVTSAPEASGCLVAPPVFKTGEPRTARLAGSIPVRLRLGAQRAAAADAGCFCSLSSSSRSRLMLSHAKQPICAAESDWVSGSTPHRTREYLARLCTGKRCGVTVTGGIWISLGGPCTSSAWTALDRQSPSTHCRHHTTLGMGSRGAPSSVAQLLPPVPRWAVGCSHLPSDWRDHIPIPHPNRRLPYPLSRVSIFTSHSSDPV